MDNPEWVAILTTASSEAEAEKLATALVDSRLAACITITPIRSIYRWQGELCKEAEWQLTIKTRLDAFGAIAQKIKALHSYEVPELIALPLIAGSPDYLNWIDQQLQLSPT
ncbi:MAG: divalent-cation tolerance protein CutA [Leptolyngbya foveolarum]|uniref:Divalent-cation tolerance protein CutA n=1 Tax=Leptolyngbya foveolarum TaxID=47253 RepID=A0A2W4W145_9CYAN|nr:MAG: divalent-cation tolerance protein CutA [Leptolyngbya foveolarum]